MSQTLEALVVELRADVKGFQASLSSAAGDVSRFSNKASASVANFQEAVGRARSAILTLGTAWAAFRIGKGIIDAGIQLETMRNKMIAATGDSRVAGEALAYVREEANRLGLDVRSATDGFAGFSASALRAGLTFSQTKDIFTGVSEAAVSMRLPAEQVSLVFKALEQIAGKGTVAMEELRGQLGDALPGSFEIAAKAMGKTTAEFTKMVSNGQVLASDFLPKFGDAIRRELGGSVDEASKGAQAAFNRLGNAFFDLQSKMAQSGFLDAVTNSVKGLTDALNDPATVEGLKGFATLLGDIVTAATKASAAIGGVYAAQKERRDAVNARSGPVGLFGIGGPSIGTVTDDYRETNDLRARVLAQYAAKQKAMSDARKTDTLGSYTLGKPSAPVIPSAQQQAQDRAAKQAAALQEQLRNQVQSMRYGFASPEQQAGMDKDKELETLQKALEKKAITEQEYRDLSLQAEIKYQEQLTDIRNKARDDEQSAFESFLGIRMKSEEEMRNASLADQAKNFRETISEAAKHNRAFFLLEKAASLARALISARESVVSAYAFGSRIGGPPLGAVFAGVAAAAQAANIAAIASTSFNGGGSDVSSSSSTGDTSGAASDTSSSSSSYALSKNVYITLNGDENALFSKTTIRKLIENINDAVGDGSQLKVSLSS